MLRHRKGAEGAKQTCIGFKNLSVLCVFAVINKSDFLGFRIYDPLSCIFFTLIKKEEL
jgi:hypothetical protein